MKLSNEQCELKDLLHRFFQEKVTSDYIKSRIHNNTRTDAALVNEIKELGIFEGFSADGGGFSVPELGLLAQECGFYLVPEPLIEQVLAGSLLPQLLSPHDGARYLELIKSGAGCTVAYPQCCQLTLSQGADRLTGTIAWAVGVDVATVLVGSVNTAKGRRVFCCSLSDKGVGKTETTSLDLTTALTSLTLHDVPAVVFDEHSSQRIEDVLEATKACEAAGICKRVVEMSVEYVRTRSQFGVPIGSFQAIQHKLADCYAKSESLASLSSFAAWAAVHSADQQRLTARAAILEAAQTAPWVCETAIQAHGGIGFTWEYDLHLYLRRAKAIQAAFGMTEGRAKEIIAAV
jgi:alkylation response protein AidB-like acyl-CoA dehydrogenase